MGKDDEKEISLKLQKVIDLQVYHGEKTFVTEGRVRLYGGKWLKCKGEPRHAPKELSEGAASLCAITSAIHTLQNAAAVFVRKVIDHLVTTWTQQPDTDSTKAKQTLAMNNNVELRKYGLSISHPDHHRPCILTVISDDWGGKFTLTDKMTRKRSHTTRDIKELMPFKLVPDLYGETPRYTEE